MLRELNSNIVVTFNDVLCENYTIDKQVSGENYFINVSKDNPIVGECEVTCRIVVRVVKKRQVMWKDRVLDN